MPDSEEPVEEYRMPPETQRLGRRILEHARALRRQKDREIRRKRFVAFVVIVVYGVILASVDVRGSSHPNLEKLAWATVLGALLYAIVLDLLFEDEEEPDESKRFTRWADEDDAGE